MDLLAHFDAAVLSRILAALPQRNSLYLTTLARDWSHLVAGHLWRLVVSPDLSPGLARIAAMHCARLREVVFQSTSAGKLQAEATEKASGFWAFAAEIWCTFLKNPTIRLRQLTIRSSTAMGAATTKEIAFLHELHKSSGSCSQLETFQMEHTSAGADNLAVKSLIVFLQDLRLTSLKLRDCNLKAAGTVAICHAIQTGALLSSLLDLDLSQNVVAEEGANALAELLPNIRQLRALSLSGNGLGPVGLAALAPQLPPSLRHLDVSLNGLGTVGLASLLQADLHLEYLNIRGNWLGSTDTEVLSRLLRLLSTSLVSLDIAQPACNLKSTKCHLLGSCSHDFQPRGAICSSLPRLDRSTDEFNNGITHTHVLLQMHRTFNPQSLLMSFCRL